MRPVGIGVGQAMGVGAELPKGVHHRVASGRLGWKRPEPDGFSSGAARAALRQLGPRCKSGYRSALQGNPVRPLPSNIALQWTIPRNLQSDIFATLV
jgi:hypothetical protein